MAKIYGQLEKAQLENTTSDTASHPKGMITYRTDLNQAKVSNGTTYKLLIDEDSTQTLSNKTYASPSITGAITAAQTTTPANPASGSNKLYFKADGKLYTLDSSGNEAMVGSGTGGVKNLITNGNADDTSSSIFVPYADAASTRPVDGTGGSPTVTTSMTTSTPLDGVKSFLLTKPASNVQGQGWSVPFTIDPAYRAKSLKISVDYIVNSGTFVAGGSTTESDIIWYIYDVTNSQLIEPSNIKMFSNNSSISDKFEATFQSSATGSSYRLIAHVQSVSALAYELKVDNITVSPQTYVFGTPVTDLSSVINLTSNITTNTTLTARSQRVGDSLRGTATWVFTGANTQSGPGSIILGGLNIDSSKISSNRTAVGQWIARNAGSGAVTTGTVIAHIAGGGTTAVFLEGWVPSANTPYTIAVNHEVSAEFSVPILGWSSSVQTSDSADTRIVAARAVLTGSQSIPNSTSTTVIWNSKTYDTHAALNTSTGVFTAPVSGYYRVTSMLEYAANTTGFRDLSVNGVSIHFSPAGSLPSGNHFFKGATTVYVNAGQTISITANQSSGGSLNIGGSSGTYNHVSIELVQGPSAIAASERIGASYGSTSGQSLTTSAAIVNFADKIEDTHNAVTIGANWKFTCPANGTYNVSIACLFNTAAYVAGHNGYYDVYKNGTFFRRIAGDNISGSGSFYMAFSGSCKVPCLAGDYIDIRGANERGATSLFTTAGHNYVDIERLK